MNTPCASLFDWTSPPGSKGHPLFEKCLLELLYPTKATIFGKLLRCNFWLDRCAKEDMCCLILNSNY